MRRNHDSKGLDSHLEVHLYPNKRGDADLFAIIERLKQVSLQDTSLLADTKSHFLFLVVE